MHQGTSQFVGESPALIRTVRSFSLRSRDFECFERCLYVVVIEGLNGGYRAGRETCRSDPSEF